MNFPLPNSRALKLAPMFCCLFLPRHTTSLAPGMLLVILLLSACNGIQPQVPTSPPGISAQEWHYADLRYLEAPNCANPQHDMVAAYMRQQSTFLQLRLDLFESAAQVDYDLYIALDFRPGGSFELPLSTNSAVQWDILLQLPAASPPGAKDSSGKKLESLEMNFIREAAFDTLALQISQTLSPTQYDRMRAQFFITPTGSKQIDDQVGPVSAAANPPPKAPLLLAFYDVFPAATPAQALRQWDGAHAGPWGQRHGLKHLLDAVSRHQIPIALLDIKNSQRLAAVSYLDTTRQLQKLEQRGLLLLPDHANGSPLAEKISMVESRLSAQRFDLQASPFAYGFTHPANLPIHYPAVFASGTDIQHILAWQNSRIIPLPPAARAETPSLYFIPHANLALSAENRSTLLNIAAMQDPSDLLVLGGSLPESPWADAILAPLAFEYLTVHPWIEVLDGQQLLTFPIQQAAELAPSICGKPTCSFTTELFSMSTGQGQPAINPITLPDLQTTLYRHLDKMPDNNFGKLAWQTYISLTQPTPDKNLQALQTNTLGQTGYLIYAAQWEQTPLVQASCATDIDYDGMGECILASEKYLVILDRDGGRVVLAAARYADGSIEQWVGSQSQLALGLSDPASWNTTFGPASDPGEIPGGFSDSDLPWAVYRAEIAAPAQIRLINPDCDIQKTFRLGDSEIEIEIQSAQPISTTLPILFAPETRLLPVHPANYRHESNGQTLRLTLADGKGLLLSSTGETSFKVISFKDSQEWLNQPEDPGREVPPGHFLPFSMLKIEFEPETNLKIRLQEINP